VHRLNGQCICGGLSVSRETVLVKMYVLNTIMIHVYEETLNYRFGVPIRLVHDVA
jgi:hypothetical protein